MDVSDQELKLKLRLAQLEKMKLVRMSFCLL